MLAPSCAVQESASNPSANPKTAESVPDGSAWQPYPGASKDAEFLKKTPAAFRPFVERCDPWDDWDKPAPPFKIHGSTYYVGTCGIAAILVVNDDGLVLFDSGTEGGARIVEDNIRTLGFDPLNVKALIVSHEHFDHAGGMAYLQKLTGAAIYAGQAASPVIRSGQSDPKDPQAGMHQPMEPVSGSVRSLKNGEIGTVAGLEITAISTPGHTYGAMSYQWKSCEGDQCLTLVYADSLSPVSSDEYKFSDNAAYVTSYFDGLERLGRLDCDILLTPHPSHSQMLKRMRTDTMIEPTACAYYAIGKARDLEKRLRREAEETE